MVEGVMERVTERVMERGAVNNNIQEEIIIM